MTDGLSTLYRDLLGGSYDCVDRIVLNAYFRMGHDPGGFRVWWRALTGSDETLENAYLMRLAGRFSRRIRGYAKAHDIPVIDCSAGQRKHDLAEEYLAKTTVTQGLFLVLVGRAQAPVWDVSAKHHIERKKPMPYVNHYSFHILDPDWGHLTIKISGHPPFPAQVILNGHEYVACQARRAGIAFTKEGNCFTTISDAAGLAKIADTLSEHRAIGRLSQVCERWIYTCVCFALDFDEQKRSGFRYQYSNYQIEYSRNLVFEVGGHMDQVFQALIDRSRAPLDLKTIKTILGYRAESTGRRNTTGRNVAMAGRRRSDRALRDKLRSPGRPGMARREDRLRFWALIAAGLSSEDAAIGAGVSPPVGTRWFREAGGMPPSTFAPSSKPLSGRYLA